MLTPEERQTTANLALGTSRAHALNLLCFRLMVRKKTKNAVTERIYSAHLTRF